MITNYNKYINKNVELVREKVELNLDNIVKLTDAKNKEVDRDIIHNSITVDDHPVKIGSEYYAIFYLTPNTSIRRVGKVKIDSMIKKPSPKGDKNINVFKFRKISISDQVKNSKLRDYKVLTSDSTGSKLGQNEITGFYLYNDEIPTSEINNVVKRYGYDPVVVEGGNVYRIINNKGKEVKLTVYNVDGDGILTGYDFDNKQLYDNYKVKNIKSPDLLGTVGEYYNDIINKYKVENLRKNKDYKLLNISDKKVFIEEKIDKLNRIEKMLSKFPNDEEIKNLKLDSKIKNLIVKYNKEIDKLKVNDNNTKNEKTKNSNKKEEQVKDNTKKVDNNPNPTEKKNSNVKNDNEQQVVNDMEEGEKKAQEVQLENNK